MSFINKSNLLAFVSDNNFIIADPEPEGSSEVYKQVDDIIYQHTKIKAPAEPDNAIPSVIQNYACILFLYFTQFKGGEISQDRRLVLRDMRDMVMADLQAVKAGNLQIKDQNGNIISKPSIPVATFESTRRVDMI